MDQVKGKGQRQSRGGGEGPMGKPKGVNEMDKIKEATDLVDVILTGDYEQHKIQEHADEETDAVLDEVENKIDTVPDQDLMSLHNDVVDELTKDEGITQMEEKIAMSISMLIREEEYREFFKKMLKKYNITNPSELDDEKKKAFFNTVDREWKAKKESD